MKRPLILIAGCPTTPVPGETAFPDWKRDATNEAYSTGVTRAGGVPVMACVTTDLTLAREQVAAADGLLLPGGGDIDPAMYGDARDPLCGPSDPVLDFYDWALLDAAREKGIPVFGICRGIQVVNCYYGGTLWQDWSLRDRGGFKHNHYDSPALPCHGVDIVKGSFLDRIFGVPHLEVNSLHHQIVKKIGRDLRIAATSSDGAVEALESTKDPVYAVQWHPEALLMRESSFLPLWRDFIVRCSQKAF